MDHEAPAKRGKRIRRTQAVEGEVETTGASETSRSSKHQSSSYAVGGRAAGIGQTRSRRSRPRATGIASVADSGSHENACGRARYLCSAAGVYPLTRRPCRRSDRAKQSRGCPGPDDPDRGIAITPTGEGARLLAVECDHPAIRGAVIAFVTERSCRRRAWLLLLLLAIAELRSATSASRSRRLL